MTTMYTVFGCLNDEDQPHVRVEDVDVVEAELTDGLHHVHAEFSSHGDDPPDAFLRVAGIDESQARDTYDRLFHMMKLVLPTIWGGPTPTVRVELTDTNEEIARIEIETDLVGWRTQVVKSDPDLTLRGMVIR